MQMLNSVYINKLCEYTRNGWDGGREDKGAEEEEVEEGEIYMDWFFVDIIGVVGMVWYYMLGYLLYVICVAIMCQI